MLIKKITTFILTVLVLATLSTIDLYYIQNSFTEVLYRKDLIDISGVPLIIIIPTSIIYLTLFKRLKYLSLLQQGFICILINLSLLFIITLPTVGFIGVKILLWHLIGISIFCFCIPLTYSAFKKVLNIPIDETES